MKKALLSILLLFHLCAILVAPNSSTYLGHRLFPILKPYLNFFELMSSWNFFAPEPGPPPVFVEWEWLDAEGNSLTGATERMPKAPDPYFFRERQNRRIALTRFLVASDERIEAMLVPYLCRSKPEAHTVRVWREMYTIPSLNEIADGSRLIGDDIGAQKKPVGVFECGGRS